MKDIKCPVCKQDKNRVNLLWVPLGHGRPCRYICTSCEILFDFGNTKFGMVQPIEKDGFITNGYTVTKIEFTEIEEISPEHHEDFQPDIYCGNCKNEITDKGRQKERDKEWTCSPKCKKETSPKIS